MTNAEKFLKDGVDGIRPLLDKCREIGAIDSGREYRIEQMLKEQDKPTLTEDERIILRNIKGYTTIIRNAENNIQVENEDGSFACLCAFNHLFQFIKLGEKNEIKELLQND